MQKGCHQPDLLLNRRKMGCFSRLRNRHCPTAEIPEMRKAPLLFIEFALAVVRAGVQLWPSFHSLTLNRPSDYE
jgi:hypothetical protein